MNVSNLQDKQHILISYLQNSGYSKSYVVKIKRAINFVLSHPDNFWSSYEDVFAEYDSGKGSSYYKQRKSNMSVVANFDINGVFPGSGHHPQIRKKLTNYDRLNDKFKALVDHYSVFIATACIEPSTIKSKKSMAASLLYKLQLTGCNDLVEVTENQMIELYCSLGSNIHREYRTTMQQLILLLSCSDNDSIRLISYIPKVNDPKKNKNFLSTEDIAELLIDSVDFDRDVINIIQEKTDVPLSLPLRASFGNLLFDYIEEERPKSNSPYVFLSLKPPYREITSGLVSGGIANKLYDAASIRMNEGDRRGGHLFRSHLATTMVEKKIKRPVISSVLGHENATSIEPYLGSDFIHLKTCALSIEDYPISEEVFEL